MNEPMNELMTAPLASSPDADQLRRFALLTPEQRFQWLVDMLALCHDLATPEARASWRRHKAVDP